MKLLEKSSRKRQEILTGKVQDENSLCVWKFIGCTEQIMLIEFVKIC